jgi:hypothetical protein
MTRLLWPASLVPIDCEASEAEFFYALRAENYEALKMRANLLPCG